MILLVLVVLVGVGVVAMGLRRQQAEGADLPSQLATLKAELAAKAEDVLRLEKQAESHREEHKEFRVVVGRWTEEVFIASIVDPEGVGLVGVRAVPGRARKETG
ncbi:MAG: hypothetical protein IH921_12970, partial [Gemmatimonadetes bacterium]|nr:hypothetical protein [Gemmatimonadota bacterium]